MNKIIAGFGLACVLLAGLQGKAAEFQNEDRPRLTVYIYNYAKLDQSTLEQTEKVARELLRRIGVESDWNIHPLVKPEGGVADDTTNCGLAHINLGILPREMAEKFDLPSNLLGVAPGTGNGRNHLYVFSDRAKEMAKKHLLAFQDKLTSYHATFPQILAHAIAHELAHLLGVGKHSRKGVMFADWNGRILDQIASKSLRFNSDEAAAMREEIRRRLHSELASATPVNKSTTEFAC